MLSNAKKEILVKTMAKTVPTYTMSVFKLISTLCDEMSSMVHKFWWGQMNEKNKMTWLSWDKMCMPKEKGGLVFMISRSSTLHYSPNKEEDYKQELIH